MPKITTITFDLDDTLWDMLPVLINAEQQVYQWLKLNCPAMCDKYDINTLRQRKYAIAVQYPELKHQLTQLRIKALAQVLVEEGYSQPQATALSEEAFDVFIAARHQVTLFDDTLAILDKLARSYRLGVLTNGNADVTKIGLGEYFEFAFSAEQLNASKPQQDHFLAAEKFCKTKPCDMIHIGDHPRKDIQAAIDYGWHSIWVNFNNTPWKGRGKPSAITHSLAEIPAAITTIAATYA